jgi:hypothetical protein
MVEIKPDVWGRVKPNVIQDQINKLGMQGWELVSVVSHGLALPMFAFFKREA